MYEFDDARRESVLSSAGGFPFLFVNGLGWLTAGVLAFYLPLKSAALCMMFVGMVTMPLSFGLQAAMKLPKASKDNPLTPLAIQLATSQLFFFPALIVIYVVRPEFVPLGFACAVGAHFTPYAWLQMTKVYVVLAAAVSIGGYALINLFSAPLQRFVIVCFWTGLCLIVGAFLVKAWSNKLKLQTAAAA